MHNSIEARIPFLDHDLIEFGFNLPSGDQFDVGISRKIFKQCIKKKYKIDFSPIKKNISDPQREWMRTGLKDFFMDTINSSDFKNIDFLDHKSVKKNYSNFIKKKFNSSLGLFQIVSYFYFKKIFSKKLYETKTVFSNWKL